jgi:hypothetical protein
MKEKLQKISSKEFNQHKSKIRVKIFKGSNIPDLEKIINNWLERSLNIEIVQVSFQRCISTIAPGMTQTMDCAIVMYRET